MWLMEICVRGFTGSNKTGLTSCAIASMIASAQTSRIKTDLVNGARLGPLIRMMSSEDRNNNDNGWNMCKISILKFKELWYSNTGIQLSKCVKKGFHSSRNYLNISWLILPSVSPFCEGWHLSFLNFQLWEVFLIWFNR